MRCTAADVLIETILDWGVEVIFGLPGDGINGIMEALRKRKDRVSRIFRSPKTARLFIPIFIFFMGAAGI